MNFKRLQKLIAERSSYSRRKAEELITSGRVKVNGIVVKDLGTKVKDSDEVMLDNVPLLKKEKKYVLLYKPPGVLSSVSDPKNRTTVVDLIGEPLLYPVGRLDYDTSGLILLTNDGEFANLMMHPRYEIAKTYEVKINGFVPKYKIKLLEKGLDTPNIKTSPAKVRVKRQGKKTSTLEVTIREGINHEIKRMFKEIGYEVVKLKRITYGNLDLNGLKMGEYRFLSKKEVSRLYNLAMK